MLKIKYVYKIELKTPKTMKLFGSTKNLVKKTKKGEKVPSLELIEVVLLHCNLVDRSISKDLKYYTLSPQISLMLIIINVEPSNLVFLETYNTEFYEIIITFTDQNYGPLEIENKFNLT